MSFKKYSIRKYLYPFSDIVWVLLTWLLAFYIRFYGPIEAPKGIPEWPVYLKLTPFIFFIWLGVLFSKEVYSRRKLSQSFFSRSLEVLKSCIIGLVVFIFITYFYQEYRYSRLTLAIFAFLHPCLILVGRSFLDRVIQFFEKGTHPRSVLFIGSSSRIRKYLDLENKTASLNILGVIPVSKDEDRVLETEELARELKTLSYKTPSDWVDFLSRHRVETVVFALERDAHDYITENLEAILEQIPDVKVFPDLSYLESYNSGLEVYENTPIVHVHDSPLKGFSQFSKRLFDILGSLFCILVFSPLLILISVLVKMSSPGKILYKQERMGVDAKLFSILKFRTMPENVEQKTGAIWAQKGDGRSTKIGSFLRKTSLDELPQLFNVLLGDMSLVGPRPERPVFVMKFRRSVPGYMLRHKVKAGMTGWAQINGWRGNTSIEKRIEADLYYIKNWSLWLDIKILFLTLIKGFINTNAY